MFPLWYFRRLAWQFGTDGEEVNSEKFEVILPYPPTANLIWRHGNGRVWSTLFYKSFVAQVAIYLRDALADKFEAFDQYAVSIELFPSDRRRRDIDNPVKPLLDAITKSGLLWRDDSQIRALSVVKGKPARSAFVYVSIASADELPLISPTKYGKEEYRTKK